MPKRFSWLHSSGVLALQIHDVDLDVLQVFENYVKEATARLSRKVEDLEDVRFVMAMLIEVSDIKMSVYCIMREFLDI